MSDDAIERLADRDIVTLGGVEVIQPRPPRVLSVTLSGSLAPVGVLAGTAISKFTASGHDVLIQHDGNRKGHGAPIVLTPSKSVLTPAASFIVDEGDT